RPPLPGGERRCTRGPAGSAADRLARPERMDVPGIERHAGVPGSSRSFLGVADFEQDVVERLDVRERMVAWHVPVVPPPDVDGGPRDRVEKGWGSQAS